MAHECLEKRGLTDKRPIIADRDNDVNIWTRCSSAKTTAAASSAAQSKIQNGDLHHSAKSRFSPLFHHGTNGHADL